MYFRRTFGPHFCEITSTFSKSNFFPFRVKKNHWLSENVLHIFMFLIDEKQTANNLRKTKIFVFVRSPYVQQTVYSENF